jgi:phage gp29-like protein
MSEFNEKVATKVVLGETLGETLDEMELTERQLCIYNEIQRNVSHTAKSLARQLDLIGRQ